MKHKLKFLILKYLDRNTVLYDEYTIIDQESYIYFMKKFKINFNTLFIEFQRLINSEFILLDKHFENTNSEYNGYSIYFFKLTLRGREYLKDRTYISYYLKIFFKHCKNKTIKFFKSIEYNRKSTANIINK